MPKSFMSLLSKEEIKDTFEKIIDNSFDGIYITDAEANTILINKAYENITGLKKKDVLGRNMEDLVKKKIVSDSGSLLVKETGNPVTMYQTFQTGKRALITSSPIYDSNHHMIMIETNVRDLTEIYNLKIKAEEDAAQNDRMYQHLEHLKQEMMDYDMVAEDPHTLAVLEMAKKVCDMDTTVMLLGETGAGKEVFAKYIFQQSPRSSKPFIQINCGAIPENLLESELFGYEKGAFTGADRKGKAGMFELADKGTLFLDEIGELPLSMQVKLLRALQSHEVIRVGGTRPVKVDVRIIAATNRNLEKMVENGEFREDLYYRLMVFPLYIPPLRQRIGEIKPLVDRFTEHLNRKYRKHKKFSATAVELLKSYSFPGNIRELKNIVERAFIISTGDLITADNLPFLGGRKGEEKKNIPEKKLVHNLPAYVEKIELQCIKDAYEAYGNVRDAAKSLGISAATFTRKRKKAQENM